MNSIGRASRLLRSLSNSLVSASPNSRQTLHASAALRGSAFYPVNDDVFGLNEDQKQLRQSVFHFCQTELAPFASDIDKNNGWPETRVSAVARSKWQEGGSPLFCCANGHLS